MSRFARTVAWFAVTLHFGMILIVVTHLDEWMAARPAWQKPAAVLSLYSLITFANRNFGFFAPEVTADWNLDISVVDELGRRTRIDLPKPSREMEVKLYSMLGHFGESEDTMDLFARSWAVYAMNREPSAVRVDIEVTRNWLPSMRDYRNGKRVTAEPYYRTTFELR